VEKIMKLRIKKKYIFSLVANVSVYILLYVLIGCDRAQEGMEIKTLIDNTSKNITSDRKVPSATLTDEPEQKKEMEIDPIKDHRIKDASIIAVPSETGLLTPMAENNLFRLNPELSVDDLEVQATRLAESGHIDAVKKILSQIESSAGAKRDAFIRSLQAVKSPEAFSLLIGTLKVSLSDVQMAEQLKSTISKIAQPIHIWEINQQIPSSNSGDNHLRDSMLEILAHIQNTSAIQALAELSILSKDESVVRSALMSLSSMGDPEAVLSLIGVIENRGVIDLESPYAQALMSAANKDARLLLFEESVRTDNPVIRYATAHALALLEQQKEGK